MNITDIRIRLVKKGDAKLKAVASIIIDDSFAVHDIKIIEGTNGNFIAMPSRKGPTGDYKDIAHPIKTDVRERLCALILDAYEKALAEDVRILAEPVDPVETVE
ncbi:MAG: septation regulator SpoVG [Clostridiales bacterium]|jgi:stage V sporulation protein G|nr:septation regulator SpoVG [Clostridiales bacterium]